MKIFILLVLTLCTSIASAESSKDKSDEVGYTIINPNVESAEEEGNSTLNSNGQTPLFESYTAKYWVGESSIRYGNTTQLSNARNCALFGNTVLVC